MSAHLHESVRPAGDAFSIAVTIATLADWLPAVAALLTIVWTAIRIWETRTVQAWRAGKSEAPPNNTSPPLMGGD